MKKDKNIINVIASKISMALDVEQIYLFGSFAKGNERDDSDYDFFIILKDNAKIRPIDAMIKARIATRGISARTVDILAMRKTEFNERAKRLTFEKVVADTGRLLYDRHKSVA